MGRNHGEMGVSHAGYDAGGEKSSQVEGFRLEDVDDFMFQQLRELLLVGEALPGGDGNGAPSDHLDHGGDIGVRDRLLEPGWPELVNGFGEFDRGRDIEAA